VCFFSFPPPQLHAVSDYFSPIVFSSEHKPLLPGPLTTLAGHYKRFVALEMTMGVFFIVYFITFRLLLISKLLHSIPFLFFFRFDFLVLFFHLLVSGSIMWKVEYKRARGEGVAGENLKRDEVTVSSLSHHPTR